MDRRKIDIDGVFDIETEKWDRFVCGGFITRKGFKVYDTHNEQKLVDDLLGTSGTVWAHNGGRYDCLWFLGHVVERGMGVRVHATSARVVSVRVEGLRLLDSAALVPLSLEQAAKIGGEEKSKTGLPCYCGRGCGGYCSISRDMEPKLYRELVRYLEQDCRATLKMLDTLQRVADENDLDLGATIGGSAYRTAARWAGIEPADWSNPRVAESTLYKYACEARYGGRTQVFKPLSSSGFRYDINSAYPASLVSLDLPSGHRREYFGAQARRSYNGGRLGLYSAIVRVPDMQIPPLPVRLPTRVAYPTGLLTGTWAGNELAYAESQGCTIQAIGRGLSWSEARPILRDFCKRIWTLRDNAGPKTALGQWFKWYANSLTGKFAQRPETEIIRCNPDKEPTLCHASFLCLNVHSTGQRSCCKHRCMKTCGAHYPLDRNHRIWSQSVWRLADCAFVEWNAYLTAHTRTILHKQLVSKDEGMSAVYCDTDSCYSEKERTDNIGLKLGEFKYEGPYVNFVAVAPKTYAYIDAETGEYVARSKGIPEASRNFDILGGRFGGVTVNRGVSMFKTAARNGRGLFQRKKLFRAINADGIRYGDRIIGEDGLTHPQDFRRLVELEG